MKYIIYLTTNTKSSIDNIHRIYIGVHKTKDPYIFDMNINSATYKFVNFLLRAGKGLSTFTYIAQSSIKDLADSI